MVSGLFVILSTMQQNGEVKTVFWTNLHVLVDMIVRSQNHYLLQCPLFFQGRHMMANEIRELTTADITCGLCELVELDINAS